MSGVLLHLLRHGTPEIPGLLLGRTDAAPLASGIALCAARTQDLAIEHIVASDLARAERAAAAIGEPRTLPVTLHPRWRELDFGDWDGRAPAQVDSDALARFWEDPDRNPPPAGERWSALVDRVALALADLPDRPTLVVTHGGAIRAALAHLLGFAQAQLWSFDLPYSALISLRIWRGEFPAAQIVGLRT